MSRYEIRLAGSGGQGLILAGVILAEAAGIGDGKFVCQTQSYGPAARGGASKAEVVISDTEIDYPKAIRPDVLLALNQTSLDKYLGDLKPGGVLLVDADLVREVQVEGAVALPFTRLARELGKEMMANIVALGALATITQPSRRRACGRRSWPGCRPDPGAEPAGPGGRYGHGQPISRGRRSPGPGENGWTFRSRRELTEPCAWPKNDRYRHSLSPGHRARPRPGAGAGGRGGSRGIRPFDPAEQWVLQQVAAGGVPDLKERFGAAEGGRLSGASLWWPCSPMAFPGSRRLAAAFICSTPSFPTW